MERIKGNGEENQLSEIDVNKNAWAARNCDLIGAISIGMRARTPRSILFACGEDVRVPFCLQGRGRSRFILFAWARTPALHLFACGRRRLRSIMLQRSIIRALRTAGLRRRP
jgi:hypothetical protein